MTEQIPIEIVDAAYKVCLMDENIHPQWLLTLAWHYSRCNKSARRAIQDDWAHSIELKKETKSLCLSELGMFSRPAEEVLAYQPQVFAQPAFWHDCLTEYLESAEKQMTMELSALQQIYRKNLKGLQELFNIYLGLRGGYNNVTSLFPEVKFLLAVNQQMKAVLAAYHVTTNKELADVSRTI